MTAGQYLDDVAFTKLFRRRRHNHAQICLGLQLITAGVARRFWFASGADRDDIESAALLFALERIGKFKFARGASAFTYYTTLINNRILNQLADATRRRGRAVPFSELYLGCYREDLRDGNKEMPRMLAEAKPYGRAS